MIEHIVETHAGSVVTIRINRPDKRNALTSEMYEALITALETANADDQIGVIVIVGSGGSFSAGNDLASFLGPRTGRFSDGPAARFMKTLVKTKKPIIAAVDGVAVGIGFTMLLHCDIVFMTPNARLRLPFVDLGIVPEAGSSRLLPERIGIQRASELLLTGRFVEANEAAQLGFANEIVPTDQIEAKAASMAALLAAKPRTALLQSRALIRSNTSDLIDLIDREFDAFGIALASAETQALLAQMQKPRT